MTAQLKPLIIIPVYNGRDYIIRLIDQFKHLYPYDVLVIDDGSTDGLSQSDFDSVTYIRQESNQGKGAALKSGLRHARSREYTHAITLDADGQHDLSLIPKYLALAQLHLDHLIIGKRDLQSVSMPFHRRLSNNITSLILSLRSGTRIYDSQVGYRCYPLSDSRLWDSYEDGFQFESAVFFNASRLNIPLIWTDIPVIYSTEGSHMHLLKDTLRFIRTFFRSFNC